jgi:hypothetical protein
LDIREKNLLLRMIGAPGGGGGDDVGDGGEDTQIGVGDAETALGGANWLEVLAVDLMQIAGCSTGCFGVTAASEISPHVC